MSIELISRVILMYSAVFSFGFKNGLDHFAIKLLDYLFGRGNICSSWLQITQIPQQLPEEKTIIEYQADAVTF